MSGRGGKEGDPTGKWAPHDPHTPDDRVRLSLDVHTAGVLVGRAMLTSVDPETFATAAIRHMATLPEGEQARLVARFGQVPKEARVAAAKVFSDAVDVLTGRTTREAYLADSGLGAALEKAGAQDAIRQTGAGIP